MATPACRLIRRSLPGAFIGALVRPGIDEVLAGLDLFDEVHVSPPGGVMAPKRAAAKIAPRRYHAALLFTNSFSSALTARIAGIPRRIGYDRDARGLLLTERVAPPRRSDTAPFSASPTNPGAWAPIPACLYYWDLAVALLRSIGLAAPPFDATARLELDQTPAQAADASEILDRAGLAVDPATGQRPSFAILNPGGNDPAKRWPPERFSAVADHLWRTRSLRSLVNASPREAALADAVVSAADAQTRPVSLAPLGITLGSLKGVVASASIMVTNDTGPRHVAAAMGVPVVSLFGPTDARWTTIPFDRERIIVADPTLPEQEVANDHPHRCAIDRIGVDAVIRAVEALLEPTIAARGAGSVRPGSEQKAEQKQDR